MRGDEMRHAGISVRRLSLWTWLLGGRGRARQLLAVAGYVVIGLVALGAATSSSGSNPHHTSLATTSHKQAPSPPSTATTPSTTSGTLPKQGFSWAALKSCLTRHSLIDVTSGEGINGAGSLPGDRLRRNMTVSNAVSGRAVATVGDYGTSAAARATLRSYNAAAPLRYRKSTHRTGQAIYQDAPHGSVVMLSIVHNCVAAAY